MIPVIILCGGKGTRIREFTNDIPKALIEIGKYPLLYHIMRHYGKYGFGTFYLTLGYQGYKIKEWFRTFQDRYHDMSYQPHDSHVLHAPEIDEFEFRAYCIETGLETQTGGRLKAALALFKKMEIGNNHQRVMVTYGDGISDIDLGALLKYHEQAETIGTITVVHPQNQFGRVFLHGRDKKDILYVSEFAEKPPDLVNWINGGFMVFDVERLKDFNYKTVGDQPLETSLLPALTQSGELAAYCHNGYWQSLDTFKDYQTLCLDHAEGKF